MSLKPQVEKPAKQSTKHWPQYLAGASAAGGAFALGTVLGKIWFKINLKNVENNINKRK